MFFEELSSRNAIKRALFYAEIKAPLLINPSSKNLIELLNSHAISEVVFDYELFNSGLSSTCRTPSELFATYDDLGHLVQNGRLSTYDAIVIDCQLNQMSALLCFQNIWELIGPGTLVILNGFGGNWRQGEFHQKCKLDNQYQGTIIEKLDKFLVANNVSHYVSDGTFFCHKDSLRLVDYKDQYKGERVFIVGNGPSLNETNLDLIKGEYSFAMNRIPLLYSRTDWRPSFYIYCSDNVHNPNWGDGWKESVNEAVNEPFTTSFIWDRYLDVVKDQSKVVPIQTMSEMELGCDGTFSQNADQYISKTGTSINVAYQLALYMGFEQIVLIGADLSWKTGGHEGDDHNHFDPNYRAKIPNGERERRRMRYTHKVAREFFAEHGVSICNATVNTYLDIFPLVDFDTIATEKSWRGPTLSNGYQKEGFCALTGDMDMPSIKEKRELISKNWNLS